MVLAAREFDLQLASLLAFVSHQTADPIQRSIGQRMTLVSKSRIRRKTRILGKSRVSEP